MSRIRILLPGAAAALAVLALPAHAQQVITVPGMPPVVDPQNV